MTLAVLGWLIDFLGKHQFVTKKTADELSFLNEHDRKLTKDYLLPVTGYTLAGITLLFILVFLASGAEPGSGNPLEETAPDTENYTNLESMLFMAIICAPMCFLFPGVFVFIPPEFNLRHTPFPERSWGLYHWLRFLVTRLLLSFCSATVIIYALAGSLLITGGEPDTLIWLFLYLPWLTLVFFLFLSFAIWTVGQFLKPGGFSRGNFFLRRLGIFLLAYFTIHFLVFCLDLFPTAMGKPASDMGLFMDLPSIIYFQLFFEEMAAVLVWRASIQSTIIALGLIFFTFYLGERDLYQLSTSEHGLARETNWKDPLNEGPGAVKVKAQDKQKKGETRVFQKGFAAYFGLTKPILMHRPWFNFLLFVPIFYGLYLFSGSILLLVSMLLFTMAEAEAWKDPFVEKSLENHPMALRLIPQTPGVLVNRYILHVIQVFFTLFWLPLLAISLLGLVPLRLPSGVAHESDWETFFSFGLIIPLHWLALNLLFKSRAGKEGYHRDLKRQNTNFGHVHAVLFSLYALIICVKFDFVGNFLLSTVFHLGVAVFMLFLALAIIRMRLVDYLSCHRLSSGYLGSPVRDFRDRIQLLHSCRALVLVFMVLVLVAPAGYSYQLGIESQDYEMGPIPEENILVYQEETLLENEVLELDRNLIISANLQMRNTTLLFTSLEPGELGLYVLEEGSLDMENVSITSLSHFNFEVYGWLNVRDSSISRVWGNDDYVHREGGIELYNGRRTTSFWNTTISDCKTNGIMGKDSRLLMENCTLRDLGSDAVEMEEGYIEIRNCTIRDCYQGIVVTTKTRGEVTGTTTMDITKQSFRDNAEHRKVVLEDNNFEKGKGFLEQHLGVQVTSYIVLLLLVLSLLPWERLGKDEKKKEELKRRGEGT